MSKRASESEPAPGGTWRPGARRRGQLEWAGLALLLGGLLAGLAACANPRAPSGGPRDETPPSIVETRPVRDTVNVSTDTRSVTLEFSEYVERNSLPRALSITPQFDGRLRFSWSGQAVTVELPSALRDSTTYIFSLSADLTDAHGVSLDQPVTVAFSTGPRINQGRIRGRVVGPRRGEGQAQVDVFAYALAEGASSPPTSLPDRPAYRTQTGEEGTFSFNYLREQDYYVVALRDNNRNRRPDAIEPFAVPPRGRLPADEDSTEIPVPWLLTQADTTGPQFQQVTPLSRRRLQLSFNEPVRPGTRESGAWALRDSVADTPVEVRSVYRPPDRAAALVLRTAPMDSTRHTLPLTPGLVVDTLGQGVRPDTARFHAIGRADTTRTRFQTFLPENLPSDSLGNYFLLPDVRPGVQLTQIPDSSTLRSMLAVRDTAGQPRPYEGQFDEGRVLQLQLQPPLRPGETAEVAVTPRAGPDTTYRRRFQRVTDRVLGALEGRAVLADTTYETTLPVRPRPGLPDSRSEEDSIRADATDRPEGDSLRSGPIVVEIFATESRIPVEPRRQAVVPGSTFVFDNLPEGSFRFRAFQDRNGNGRWDGGRIRPFVPAEPIVWSESTTDSRPRWTNVLPAALRVPVLRLVEVDAPAPDSTAVDSLSEPGR